MSPPESPADEQLMRAYATGQADAFDMLYDRHQIRLWRYIFRSVGDTATADDLAQEVWLRVARQADSYRPRAGAPDRPVARFTTWLFTLARNRTIDHLRAARPTVSLDEALDGGSEHTLAETLAAPSGFGPVRRIENRQQAAQLLAALEALPPGQRDAFLLQAEGGMSVADIAAATGVGAETAKSRLRYARAALRRALEDVT
jgi:RNA polymerase sigma-70 factor (ECF subfamily)